MDYSIYKQCINCENLLFINLFKGRYCYCCQNEKQRSNYKDKNMIEYFREYYKVKKDDNGEVKMGRPSNNIFTNKKEYNKKRYEYYKSIDPNFHSKNRGRPKKETNIDL